MKTRLTKNLVRSTALALCVAGLALSGPSYLRAAEQATNPTTGTYGSGKNYKTTMERQSEGELSADDLHHASLLSIADAHASQCRGAALHRWQGR